MSGGEPQQEPHAVEHERRSRTGIPAPGPARPARPRLVAGAATALAVTLGFGALTWAAVTVTEESADLKPLSQKVGSCAYTLSDPHKRVPLPSTAPPARGRPYTVKLATSMGAITFETLGEAAPCATNSLVHLARAGYYDGSACHRVSTRNIFVLECGDPAGKGTADPGYYFGDENLAGATYKAGTVAMSKVVPGRNGSQFFISYADPQVRMAQAWTPFGTVVGGLDVLKRIGGNGTADGSFDGRPKKPVVIESVTVR
ncbi:peptidylprolyl isomerase [Streptomyces sp. NPDC048664]|uniref:peptidylprolyl isomerase n=1 Tax=Streptomyces sp. NPDC048664 TaxID=3154505 RepID=UPI00341C9058